MKVGIDENVAALVRDVIDIARVMSRGREISLINDLKQAKAVFEKKARRIDRSSPWKAHSRVEQEVEFLFTTIPHLQDGRYESNEMALGVLCCAHHAFGYLTATLVRNMEFSLLGRAGARKRYAPMRDLEAWALTEYGRGNWKSANQAAYELKDSVIAHGRTIGAYLTESNAQRTIAEWINKDKKRSSRYADTSSG